MKTRTIGLTLAFCLLGVGICLAADPQIGTWKLNEAKSKSSPEAGKNSMVVVERSGKEMKVTVEGVDDNGKPTHNEWTGKFDGKDYPVTGDPNSDARSYKKVNERTCDVAVKKDGKVTLSGTVTVSGDGKTRTVTVSGTDPKGKKVDITAVYDKQ